MKSFDRCRHRVAKRTTDDAAEIKQHASMRQSRTFRWMIVEQILVLSVLWSLNVVQGQLIGTDICGCQPATYTFTFDFDLTCDDNNVDGGPGINETACLTEVRGEDQVPDEDLIPVTVQSVQIFELDQNLQVFSQTVRTGTFVDGSNFTYTSIISTITDLGNVNTLPRGLQLVITGLNNKEQSTVNTFIITYTNNCGIFPILTVGQTSGWTIFSDLGDPPTTVCPLVPSMAPTTSVPGTASPTFAPTIVPTSSPSVAPITLVPPSPIPANITESPVTPETEAPVTMETDAPVAVPVQTDAPVDVVLPTCAPIGPGGGKGGGGKGSEAGKGGKGSGKGGDSGKGGKGGKGSGKGDDSGKGGKAGKGSDIDEEYGKGGKGYGKGEDDSSLYGKGGKGDGTIRKKKIYDGKMDKLSTEDEERRLRTGGVECPEIPDDDYYLSKGKGKGKGKGGGKGDGGSGKGGKGKGDSEGKGGKGKGDSEGKGGKGKGDSEGKGGKGEMESMGGKGGKGDDAYERGKGKGVILMKKSKDNSGHKMEVTRKSNGKGENKSKDVVLDDDYDGEGKGGHR